MREPTRDPHKRRGAVQEDLSASAARPSPAANQCIPSESARQQEAGAPRAPPTRDSAVAVLGCSNFFISLSPLSLFVQPLKKKLYLDQNWKRARLVYTPKGEKKNPCNNMLSHHNPRKEKAQWRKSTGKGAIYFVLGTRAGKGWRKLHRRENVRDVLCHPLFLGDVLDHSLLSGKLKIAFHFARESYIRRNQKNP